MATDKSFTGGGGAVGALNIGNMGGGEQSSLYKNIIGTPSSHRSEDSNKNGDSDKK